MKFKNFKKKEDARYAKLNRRKFIRISTCKGSENEVAIDIKTLRGVTNGVITIDPGFKNTGSCASAITFLDGEKGIFVTRICY